MMDKRILKSFLMMGFGLDQRPKLSIPYTRSETHSPTFRNLKCSPHKIQIFSFSSSILNIGPTFSSISWR